jgi:hypothetical protein
MNKQIVGNKEKGYPGVPEVFQDPAVPLIGLPTRFTSRRANRYNTITSGSSIEVANLTGPGCVRHIWIMSPLEAGDASIVRLEINVDGAEKSQVDLPLKPFFGIMHDFDYYVVDCAAYTVLPNPEFGKLVNRPGEKDHPGYNLYLPIPFAESCRITIHNPVNNHATAQVDWHQYERDAPLTPYRLHTSYQIDTPAPPKGNSVEMANVEGEGFVAGLVVGYIHRDQADLVYHTGGMTFLLDGESNPHAIRGHNLEDDYGFAFGFNDHQSRWIGCPWFATRDGKDQDGVFYRFFGPDPIYFRTSLSFRAGARGDDMESVVYTYRIPGTTAPPIESPAEWQVTEQFDLKESWDGFRQSSYDSAPDLPFARTIVSDHGWIDLRLPEPYYGNSSVAYARTRITSSSDVEAILRLAVDDWAVVWLNGEEIAAFRHDEGLEVTRTPVRLRSGPNELLLRTTNSDTPPNKRLWAINCAIERGGNQ